MLKRVRRGVANLLHVLICCKEGKKLQQCVCVCACLPHCAAVKSCRQLRLLLLLLLLLTQLLLLLLLSLLLSLPVRGSIWYLIKIAAHRRSNLISRYACVCSSVYSQYTTRQCGGGVGGWRWHWLGGNDVIVLANDNNETLCKYLKSSQMPHLLSFLRRVLRQISAATHTAMADTHTHTQLTHTLTHCCLLNVANLLEKKRSKSAREAWQLKRVTKSFYLPRPHAPATTPHAHSSYSHLRQPLPLPLPLPEAKFLLLFTQAVRIC